MKTAADVRLARTLLETLERAKEFRESFEDQSYASFPIVDLRDINVTEERCECRSAQGFEGSLEIPKPLAIEMMLWLEQRAREELEKIGVRV